MISKIRLKNWQTHIDSSFVFSEGINALLGVMGSGKSSVLDAISFAFFGTFPAVQKRRIKLEDVVTDLFTRHETTEVYLEFEKDGKAYSISRKIERKRGTSISELRCEGKLMESPASQRVTERIEKILGIDYTMFAQVIYCEQNRLDQFLQIPRGQRMKKIDELLKIDRFETARSNIISLKNRMQRTAKDIERQTVSLKNMIESKRPEDMREDIGKIEIKIEAFQRRLEEIKKSKDILRQELDILEKKKKIYDKQKERQISVASRISQIKEELNNYSNTEKIESYTIEFIETQASRLDAALKKQKSLEKDVAVLEDRIRTYEQQLKKEKESMETLDKGRPKLRQLEKAEKELEQLNTDLGKLLKEEATIQSKIEDSIKSIDALEKADANCPTCDTRLDTEKKSAILKKKKDEITSLENSLVIANKEMSTTKEDIRKKEEEKKDCMKYINVERDIAEKSVQIKKIEAEQKELKEKYEDSMSVFSPEKIKKIEEEIRRFEITKTILRHIYEKRTLEEEEKQLKIDAEELRFSPDEFDRKTKEFIAQDKLFSTDSEKLKSLGALYTEKKNSLKLVDEQAALIRENENKSEHIENIIPELEKFRTVLESTQIMLRERFIESINDIMEDLWVSVYPYSDYTGIRISVEEGDYILQLKNMESKWMNVEGTVSGGERMTAVLVLRIAMTIVLTPNMKMLLLDEPTHNLDRKAVEELAETLRNKVSGIVEQVFLITHDEAMEGAVTGKLYRLKRGSNKEDVTEVVEV